MSPEAALAEAALAEIAPTPYEGTGAARVIALEPGEAEGRAKAIAATYSRPELGGICVVDGFACSVRVERGALQVSDGVGEHRRIRRYDKATHGLSRIVVANAAGTLSLEALAFCERLGIGVLVLGGDGRVQLASNPRMTDDARLRRAQGLAPARGYGLDIAKLLLGAKLKGQAALVAARFPDEADRAEIILDVAEVLAHVGNGPSAIEEARQLEATAAAAYFSTWAGRCECVPVFAAKDRKRIPPHWSTFETRRSVLASASSNRKAERPTNAMLNYTFALLEAEAIFACHAVGLDPGLGIVHADARSRASMALDLIEPVRPEAEAFVLDLLGSRTFAKSDFIETTEGHVRLMAPLTHELAESLPRWRKAIAPWAERVAHIVGAAMEGKYSPVTPLTSAREKAAQAVVKARRLEASERARKVPVPRQAPPVGPVALPISCLECGALVTNPRHVRCEACIDADPAQAPGIRASRGRAIASRKQALIAWDEAHPGATYDPERFARDILPRLGTVRLSEIMEAAGCCKATASGWRNGRTTPHVSTWPALARLVGAEVPEPVTQPGGSL